MTTNTESRARCASASAALLFAATIGLAPACPAAETVVAGGSKAAAVQDARLLRIAPQLARLHDEYAAHAESGATQAFYRAYRPSGSPGTWS